MKRIHTKVLAAVLLLAGLQQAHALGTTQGTSVANTASVDFTVGGVNQPDINSNTTTFVVDRRIILTVAEVGAAYTDVVPGAASQVLIFTVTNNTNGSQDFRFVVSDLTTGSTDPFGGSDDFNPANFRTFVDVNNNGTYEPLVDIDTFLDEMPADTTRRVFVVADIPIDRVAGDTAGVTLTAIAAVPGTSGTLGVDAQETPGAGTLNGVDTVFGDTAGDTDALRDGRHSDTDAYRVQTATLTVTKTVVIISDPFNGTTNPKAIPGAILEYCIQVANAAGALTATNVVVNDPLASNTTFVPGSIFAGGTVTGGACNADGTAEDDNGIGADESDPNGGSFAAGTVSTMVPSVAAGVTTTSRFRVTVD